MGTKKCVECNEPMIDGAVKHRVFCSLWGTGRLGIKLPAKPPRRTPAFRRWTLKMYGILGAAFDGEYVDIHDVVELLNKRRITLPAAKTKGKRR